MELSEIILTLVGILAAVTGGVVKSLVADLKDLGHNMKKQLIGLKLQENN